MPESKPTPEEVVDETSAESFPASDPPSWAMGKRTDPIPARGPDEPSSGGDRSGKPRPGGSKVPGARQG
jgi:hypothetical protein